MAKFTHWPKPPRQPQHRTQPQAIIETLAKASVHGVWLTVEEIAAATGIPAVSVAAGISKVQMWTQEPLLRRRREDTAAPRGWTTEYKWE